MKKNGKEELGKMEEEMQERDEFDKFMNSLLDRLIDATGDKKLIILRTRDEIFDMLYRNADHFMDLIQYNDELCEKTYDFFMQIKLESKQFLEDIKELENEAKNNIG